MEFRLLVKAFFAENFYVVFSSIQITSIYLICVDYHVYFTNLVSISIQFFKWADIYNSVV
jgi:hypothetical protein